MKRKPKAKATYIRHTDHYHAVVEVRLPDGSTETHFSDNGYRKKDDAKNHARAWRRNILDIEMAAIERRGKK